MPSTCDPLTRAIVCAVLCAVLYVWPSTLHASGGCHCSPGGKAPKVVHRGCVDTVDSDRLPPYYATSRPVGYAEIADPARSPNPRAHAEQRPAMAAQLIVNPFVGPSDNGPVAPNAKPVDRPQRKRVEPQIIINPFYISEPKVACHR